MSLAAARCGVVLLLLLAGCMQDTSPQGVCERASWNDPEVKLLTEKLVGSDNLRDKWEGELQRARKRSVVTCLQADGILQPGGVEPVIIPR